MLPHMLWHPLSMTNRLFQLPPVQFLNCRLRRHRNPQLHYLTNDAILNMRHYKLLSLVLSTIPHLLLYNQGVEGGGGGLFALFTNDIEFENRNAIIYYYYYFICCQNHFTMNSTVKHVRAHLGPNGYSMSLRLYHRNCHWEKQ